MKATRLSILFSLVFTFLTFFAVNRCAETIATIGIDIALDYPEDVLAACFQDIGTDPLKLATDFTSLGLASLAALLVLVFFVYQLAKSEVNLRQNEEHGSARWAQPKEMKKFMAPIRDKNLLFSQRFGLATTKKPFKYARNRNVCLVGGSGAGKTEGYVKPNIAQLNANYFCSDTKGTLLNDMGHLLEDNGYVINAFSLLEKTKSRHWNPLAYVPTKIYKPEEVSVQVGDDGGRHYFYIGANDLSDPYRDKAEKGIYKQLITRLYKTTSKGKLIADTTEQEIFGYVYEDGRVEVVDQSEISDFVDCLISNAKVSFDDGSSPDPFWESCERILYTALLAYLFEFNPPERRTIPDMLDLLAMVDCVEGDPSWQSDIDNLFFRTIENGEEWVASIKPSYAKTKSTLRKAGELDDATTNAQGTWSKSSTWHPVSDKQSYALNRYKAFKKAADRTLQSIIMTCEARMERFESREIRELLSFDEMHLDRLGDVNEDESKMAVFFVISDTKHTFDCLYALMMWQTINVLCDKALFDYNGRLPQPVHMLLDEFANAGHLPDFEKDIAVLRSRDIWLSIMLQSFTQLKSNYEKDWGTIIDCCDTLLYFGSSSSETNEMISKRMGNETVHIKQVSEQRGATRSRTESYQTISRELMQPSELARLPRDESLILINGTYPIRDKKYDLRTHHRYKEAQKYANKFDYEAYEERRRQKMNNKKAAAAQ